MNKKVLTLLSIATVVLAAGIIGIATAVQQKSDDDANCTNSHGHHYEVVIQDSTVRPNQVSGQLCDTITFTNKDNEIRELAFGAHEDHVPYDGITERALRQDQSLTITLNKLGTYHFHDHDHDEISGDFTVSK
jgi:plastocyanin